MGQPRRHQEEMISLSRREAQVTMLIVFGKTNKEIAAELGLSDQTVKTYVSSALRKANCQRRSELATYAVVHGMRRA